MIPTRFVRDLRDRADIVDIVSAHVKLRRTGRSFVGLCPFHQEKTPSFHVNPERQIYHCFGCQKGGDVISFLMEIEGASFMEVVRDLAQRIGIEVPQPAWRSGGAEAEAEARRERWFRLMAAADELFRETLRDAGLGAPARDYLAARGVGVELADRFGLGFAAPAWDRLAKHLLARRHSAADAETMGLVIPRKGGDGHYDRFRGRLIFPVFDGRGRVVAFSGRALPGMDPGEGREGRTDEVAKYINSPETPLYRKGRSFLGLPQAKQAIRRTGSAVLVEGNFDLLAVHALGSENVLAPLGTALTPDQATVLRRSGASSVVLLFDPDDAGRAAARRAFLVLAAAGLAVRWASMVPGRDPADLLPGGERDTMAAVLGDAPAFLDRAVREAALATAAGTVEQRAAAARDLAPLAAAVADEGERQLNVERMAAALGIDRHLVHRMVARAGGGESRYAESVSVSADAGGGEKVGEGPGAPEAEEALLSALLARPSLARRAAAEHLEEAVTYPPAARLLRRLEARAVEADGDAALDVDDLIDAMDDTAAAGWLRGILVRSAELGPQGATERFDGALRKIREQENRRRADPLSGQIRAAQASGDSRRADLLFQERLLLRRKVKRGHLVIGSGDKR